MDTSGTNYHRSNLLGTLAYFGSPAVALRSQANASSLDATSLYSRAVVPLSADVAVSSNLGATVIADNTAAPLDTNVTVANTAPTITAQHSEATGPTPSHTDTGATGTNVHTPNVTSHDVKGVGHVEGDPHWFFNNTEWTQQGTPGDTYLVAAGNGVFLSCLYGQNGGYHDCTMQDAQLVIAANPAAGISSEVTINYGIYDGGNSVVVNDPNGNSGTFTSGYSQTWGTGDGAVTVTFDGGQVQITTSTSTGVPGQLTVGNGSGMGLEVSWQGTFDNANGLMSYIEQGSNINLGQSTLDAYAEANFNMTALGGVDSAYVINPNGMPGFQQWLNSTDPNTGQNHMNWNQPFDN